MDDMAIVYTPDNGAGWSGYHSDGTPRGDSTARIASVRMYQTEGRDMRRGIRLTRAAYGRGLHDPNIYSDFVVLMNFVRRPADCAIGSPLTPTNWAGAQSGEGGTPFFEPDR